MKKLTAIVLIVVAMVSLNCSGKGIVIVEGYEHGVAFCEEEFSMVIHKDDCTTWNDGKATYVVNAGHDKDPQVQELVKLAHKTCAQYTD